jgi:TPP-dependent pyruvate/acetoin dehydrogenase alpha subunit
MDKKTRLGLLRLLYRIRFFEEKAIDLFCDGKIQGDLHPYIGEEAIAAGACSVLEKSDYVLSTHRGHGHCLAKGEDPRYMFAEILGRETGSCKGRGGSMHICNRELGILGANGIIGGGLTIAAGSALSALYRKTNQVTLCFFGDGGANQGVFHESLNLAALWKLPVVFICENNQIAATTPVSEVIPTESIGQRGHCYGIYGNTIDGNDVEAVYDEVGRRVDASRKGEGASLIECLTFRQKPHCMDMVESRQWTREELKEVEKMDPVAAYESVLIDKGIITVKEAGKLKDDVRKEIEEAAGFALASDFPDASTVNQYVYAD